MLSILALAIACVSLRAPSLDRVSLNPDESQYEATASFLVATGSSALSSPLGTPGTFATFKAMTRLFGPYPMFEMRLLVQLVSLLVAVLLSELVRRETNRWCGLAAGLVFLHHVMVYEGLTVNREWGAVLMTVLGIFLFLAGDRRTPERSVKLAFASGVASGLALWFKLQASFIVLAIPAVLVWIAIDRERRSSALRALIAHLAGGLAAGAIYLGPYLVAGELGSFIGNVFADWNVFVVENAQAMSEMHGGGGRLYLERFLTRQPYPVLLLGAYAFALIGFSGAVLAVLRQAPPGTSLLERPGVLLFVAYLATSALCVKLGNRFFAHYYLLMLPAVAALIGFALFYLGTKIATRGPLRWAAVGLTGLLLLQAGLLVVQQQLAPTPRSMAHSPFDFGELTRELDERANLGDRLFVWGWAPEIYSLSRLEAASFVTTCEYVVNDQGASFGARPTLNPQWAELMLRDLRERQPRFIVDATAASWSSTSQFVYRLENYRDFELRTMLWDEYTKVGRFSDCDLYERK